LSHVDIYHIMGVVHLCKYWTLVYFLPAVSRCDKSKETPIFVYFSSLFNMLSTWAVEMQS